MLRVEKEICNATYDFGLTGHEIRLGFFPNGPGQVGKSDQVSATSMSPYTWSLSCISSLMAATRYQAIGRIDIGQRLCHFILQIFLEGQKQMKDHGK